MISPEKFGEGTNFFSCQFSQFFIPFLNLGIKKGSLSLIDGTIGGLFNTTALVFLFFFSLFS